MKYLTVPALVNAQGDRVPDLPPSVTNWVGQCLPGDDTYLVAVPDGATVAAKAGRTTLSTRKAQTDEMAARKLSEGDVQTWRVG